VPVEDLAIVLLVLYGILALLLPASLQLARTGSTGIKRVSGRPGSVEWFAGIGFVLAMALAIASPILAQWSDAGRLDALDGQGVHVAGIVLFAIGLAVTVGSQQWMGRSWRVGVDEGERTELVTGGPFRIVRNPIYTGVTMVVAGLALVVPSVASFASVVLMVASLEAQTRFVEEPYLMRVHGEAYVRYASRVGRFLPGVGLLRRSDPRERAR
jgi:protein-S-isoprenylcysteine O-methyltransferase Ste14